MVTDNRQILVRRDTTANWSSNNPVLAAGEPGFDTTLEKLKVGDGTTAWNSHPFIGGGGAATSGVYASRPAAGTAGSQYYCTDIDAVYLDNGSTWDRVSFGVGSVPIAEPPTSGWSTTTLGTATLAADKDGYLITAPSAAGNNLRAHYRTLSPTSNYTATMYLDFTLGTVNFSQGGMFLSNGTVWVEFGPLYSTGGNLQVASFTSATSGTASNLSTVSAPGITGYGQLHHWLRIRDDGTTRFYEHSPNGLDWTTFYSQGRTVTLTPTIIGWGANAENSGGTYTSYVRLRGMSGVS